MLGAAGCFPRDRTTIRTIDEVATGRGKWGRNAPAAPDDAWFLEGLERGEALADSDGDGIPDEWEDAHGLNKLDSRDANRSMASGYTAIEEYVNERARLITPSM